MSPELTPLQEAARATRRRLGAAVAAVVLGGVWIMVGDDLGDQLKGLREFRGQWVWGGGDDSRLGDIDLRLLHEEQLGDWVLAMGDGPDAAASAFETLSDVVRSAPGLRVALDDLRAAVERGSTGEWLGAAEAWSVALAAEGLPWRVEGGVAGGSGAGRYCLRTYEVLARGPVVIHGVDRPIQFLRRGDQLNVVEARLEHTPGDGGVGYVLNDRVARAPPSPMSGRCSLGTTALPGPPTARACVPRWRGAWRRRTSRSWALIRSPDSSSDLIGALF